MAKLSSDDKISVVSHRADLDGVASAVLASELIMARTGRPPDQVLFADYEDVKTVVARAAIDASELWIMDLSVRDTNISEFFKHIPKERMFMIDHHSSTAPTVIAWADKATILFDDSGNRCAADILFDNASILAPTYVKDDNMTHLVAATHSRDLWKNDVPEGSLLTDVIEVLGAQAVYSALIEWPAAAFEAKFPKAFQEAITIARKRRMAELQMARNTSVSHDFKHGQITYALANSYQSDIADMMLKTNPEQFVILFDLSAMKASIRCTPVMVSKSGKGANNLASLFGGGGHPCAAGFPLPADFGFACMRAGCNSIHDMFEVIFDA